MLLAASVQPPSQPQSRTLPPQANACARRRVPNSERSMARTYASVNEAWRELRNARNRAHEENYRTPQAHHGYDPDQPRVPKGHSDGGQWTDTGGGETTSEISSDATPDNEWRPGSRYAQTRGRGSVPVRIGNRWFEAEGGQAVRLPAGEARPQHAIAPVQW